MTMQRPQPQPSLFDAPRCRFCGGEDGPNHWLTCDGRQGRVEALFNLPEGRARQAKGQSRALSNDAAANDHESIWMAIRALAAGRRPFTSDDVWAWCVAHDRALHPATNVGAVFRVACDQQVIRRVPVPGVQSKRPAAQGRLVQVWIGAAA